LARIEPTEQSPLKSYLLLDPENEKGVDPEFLDEAVRRFDEDESVKPAFVTAVEVLSQELSSMNISEDYKPYVTVRELIRFSVALLTIL
jgi:ubiquitin conjugation factor E4 B